MTSPTGNSRRRAFTLVELTIVIFIMAMVMAIAMPSFVRSYHSAQVSAAARSLITACQLARLEAVTQQSPAVLHVDLSRQRFWIGRVALVAGDEESTTVVKMLDVPPRVRLVSAQVGSDPARREGDVLVRFLPNGTAETLAVAFHGTDRADALLVTLDPVTARATVEGLK